MSQTVTESEKESKMKEKEKDKDECVIIRAYPNTVYLWPTAALSFLIYLVDYVNNYFLGQQIFADPRNAALVASFWFSILFFNLVVMSFDFKLGKTFSIAISAIVLVMIYIFVIDKIMPKELSLNEILVTLDIGATANFYMLFTLLMLIIYILIWLGNLFNYWEISPNRIKHHKGLFEREENFSALNSKVVTEINDLFERLLFRAGTILITDPQGKVHILENVYKAVGKDKKIQDILSRVYIKDTQMR
jgi:hypothetical protein